MIGVRDVVVIRDALDDTEALLKCLRELVGRRLHRCTVQGVADVLFLSPLRALVVQILHDLQCKRLRLRIRMGLSGHAYTHLVEAGVAEGKGGVVSEKKLIDLLALLEACQCTILPEDRCDIRGGAHQALMTDAECTVAELQALIEDTPEGLHVAMCRAGDIHEVDRDDALVETAIILMLALREIAGIRLIIIVAEALRLLLVIRCQEGTTAHARVNIALILPHLLRRDVVRHHALRGALRCQLRQVVVLALRIDIVLIQCVDDLREGRCDPDTLLILDALHALLQDLLDDHREVITGLARRYLIEVHEHRNERCLTVTGHEGDHLILDGLYTTYDLFLQALFHDLPYLLVGHADAGLCILFQHAARDLLTGYVHERCQVAEGEGLSAILVRGHLCDDLCCDIAGRIEAVRLLDHGAGDHGAVLQHILEIHEITVVLTLCEVIRIMEVDDALAVCLRDLLREKHTVGEVSRYIAGHIVTLCGVDHRILIRVFLLRLLV